MALPPNVNASDFEAALRAWRDYRGRRLGLHLR